MLGMRTRLGFFAVLAGAIAISGVAWAEPAQVLDRASFDVVRNELLFENRDQTPIVAENTVYDRNRKEIIFFLPNTILQPTPRVLSFANDSFVKNVNMEQRAVNGIPAVRVVVATNSTTPYPPFSLTTDAHGMRMAFTGGGPARTNSPSPLIARNATVAGGAAPLSQSNAPRAASPLMLSPAVPAPVSNAAPQTTAPATPVVKSAPPANAGVIEDIFFEDKTLSIVSRENALTVKRVFSLNEPNRYVIDIAPAILSSQRLTRAIPQNDPDIASLRAGQFDESTVRLVIRFAQSTQPPSIKKVQGDRILKVSF